MSTALWDDPAVGLVRLEITFDVEGNEPPAGFDQAAFVRQQEGASAAANDILHDLWSTWDD